MSASRVALPVGASLRELVQALVDSESPSGSEASLADAIEASLSGGSHLEVLRVGNTVGSPDESRSIQACYLGWSHRYGSIPQQSALSHDRRVVVGARQR